MPHVFNADFYELSEQRQKFVHAYLRVPNAASAAREAGYAEANAAKRGMALLKEPLIKKHIDAAVSARMKRYEYSQNRVKHELATIAFSDITDYVIDEHGNLEHANKRAARAVASVKKKTRIIPAHTPNGEPIIEHETELRLWPKVSALQLMMKNQGMLTEKVELVNSEPQSWEIGGRQLTF